MYILTSIFGISFTGMIGMVMFRWWQIASGKIEYETMYSREIWKFREYLRRVIDRFTHRTVSAHKQHVAPVVHVAKKAAVAKAADIFGVMHRKIIQVKRSLDGQGDIARKGDTSSIFLKHISEYKDRIIHARNHAPKNTEQEDKI